jgi:hypothetical protein
MAARRTFFTFSLRLQEDKICPEENKLKITYKNKAFIMQKLNGFVIHLTHRYNYLQLKTKLQEPLLK